MGNTSERTSSPEPPTSTDYDTDDLTPTTTSTERAKRETLETGWDKQIEELEKTKEKVDVTTNDENKVDNENTSTDTEEQVDNYLANLEEMNTEDEVKDYFSRFPESESPPEMNRHRSTWSY